MIPGEYILQPDPIVCNRDRETTRLAVMNTGDRPIQVGSHFHFFEVNRKMEFDRSQAFGMRLNIASGTAVRFEPGELKEIELVAFGGNQAIYGFNGFVSGHAYTPALKLEALAKMAVSDFKKKQP